MGKKKTNEEFIDQLNHVNPNIIALEPYINSTTHIRCKCLKCGNEWPGIPNNLLRGEGCSQCAGHKQWDTASFVERMKTVNPTITITGEYINSKTAISYVCNICGEGNASVPTSLLKGHGCKYCGYESTKNKRRKTNQQFLSELKQKNPDIEPLEPYINSKTPILCRCSCGTVWPARPTNLLQGKKCKNCTKRQSPWSNEVFLAKLKAANPTIEALEKYKSIDDDILVRCLECGNEWPVKPRQLLRKQGCPKCKKMWQTSFPEQAIFFYIKKQYSDAENSYKGLGKMELDIYIPSIKTGIEYDGSRWHRDKGVIDKRKYDRCKELGIVLIRVRELADSSAADHIVISKYGNKKTYNALDECIIDLLRYLNASEDVNTERDQLLIKEQYYGRLTNSSLGALYPEIANEWYQPKNGKITPFMILPKSNDSFFWKCPKCGDIYPSAVSNRTSGHGCAKCAGIKKKTQEEFIKEMAAINPTIEITGDYINTKTKIEFRCRKCGKTDFSQPASLRKGRGCRHCSRLASAKKRAMSQETFLQRLSSVNPTIEVVGEYINNHTRIECRCKVCNYEWNPFPHSILNQHTGCPLCAGRLPKEVLCIETGIVYKGVLEAERQTGISHSTISHCCNGKGFTAGGYHWQFLDKEGESPEAECEIKNR